jgi:alpha-1,2-mannosyltransferase
LGLLAAAGGRYLPSGLSMGAAVLTRPHLNFVPILTGFGYLRRGRLWRPAVLIWAGSSVGFLGLLTYNWILYGRLTLVGGYSSKTAGAGTGTTHLGLRGVGPGGFLDNVAGTMLSPSRGVLVLTPFLLLLIPGLRPAWKAAPQWARYPAVGGLVYLGSQLWLDHLSGGYGFYSYRVPIESLTLAAPLLAMAYLRWTAERAWRRRAFALSAAASVGMQSLGAIGTIKATQRPAFWSSFDPLTAVQAHGLSWLLIAVGGAALTLFVARLLRAPRSLTARSIDLVN